MAEEQIGKDILEKVLRAVALGTAGNPLPTATEMMRAALALADLDLSVSSERRSHIREIINGFGNRAG